MRKIEILWRESALADVFLSIEEAVSLAAFLVGGLCLSIRLLVSRISWLSFSCSRWSKMAIIRKQGGRYSIVHT